VPLQITTPVLSTPNLPTSDSLSKLQNDVTQLKSRVDEQGRALLTLKQRQDAMSGTVDQQLLNLGTGINATAGALNTHIINTGAPPLNPTGFGAATAPVVAVTATEKAHYQNAYTLFRNGQLDPAIAEFKGIIASYPGGEFADNSQYWIGEALLKKGDKNGALLAFDQVVRSYPRSAKVPDALLKIGMTQLMLKNKAKAKEYLDFVVKNYPGTSAAGIAATKKSQAGI
jgi:tol-pal system protein YbgF